MDHMNPGTGSIDTLIQQLRRIEALPAPVLTATIDLRAGSDGQPPALRMLRQAVREAIARFADPAHPDRRSLEEDAETLEAVVAEAAARGAAGLVYIGSHEAGLLRTLETLYPLRNAVDIAAQPALFELVRYRYLAGVPVVLADIDLREVRISRVHYAVTEATDSVEPIERVEKLKQRSKREGFGGMDGAGGHAMNRLDRRIAEHRLLYAVDVAQHIAAATGPGDLLVLAGTDSGRSAIRRQLPETLAAAAIDANALDPTQDARARAEWLMGIVVEAQHAKAGEAVRRWFAGEWAGRAIAGIEGVQRIIGLGRLGTLIVHEDAVDHFGTAADARDRTPPQDARRVEVLVRTALAQGAEIVVAREPRMLAEHQGALGVARY